MWGVALNTYKAVCDICGETQEVSNYGDWACRKCLQGYTYEECHQITLTDAQLALLRNPPRWIPVEERLPEDGVRVLVWCEIAGPCVAYRGIETFALEDGEQPTVQWLMFSEPAPVDFHRSDLWDRVVAWMPLPEPPAP